MFSKHYKKFGIISGIIIANVYIKNQIIKTNYEQNSFLFAAFTRGFRCLYTGFKIARNYKTVKQIDFYIKNLKVNIK